MNANATRAGAASLVAVTSWVLACTHHPEVSPWNGGGDPAGSEIPENPAASFAFGPHPPEAVSEPGALRGPVCATKRFQIQRELGQILLVLDRSGSMANKWADVTGAVLDTVLETEKSVMWGLLTFPKIQSPACTVSDAPDVPFAIANHMQLSTLIPNLRPVGMSGGSPARLGMLKAIQYLKAQPGQVPRYIVLASDGAPNCRGDIAGAELDVEPTVKAVRAAAAAGYHTFVTGIAADKDHEGVLSDIAEAGLEAREGKTKYFAVQNRKELAALLKAIATRLSDCVYPLDVLPPEPDRAEIKIDGVRLRRDPAHLDGWDYLPGMTSVRVYGPTCERLSQPGGPPREIEVKLGCPTQYIP